MKGRRLTQYLHVKDTIKILVELGKNPLSLKFARLITLIEKESRVLSGVSSGRYAAMIKSVMRGHVDDTDVRWHERNVERIVAIYAERK